MGRQNQVDSTGQNANVEPGMKKENNGLEKNNSPTIYNFFKGITYAVRLAFNDDEWVYDEEPHIKRRQEILTKYPEIKQLMGPDHRVAYYITLEVLFQFFMATMISIYQPHWLIWLILTYAVSGTINHSLGCAIHEVGHNLAFGHKYGTANRILSLFCNLPMAVPIAISYKKYHQAHHRWLGHEESDTDMPLRIEASLFKHPLSRFFWLCIHPLLYAFRPFLKSPRPITVWELINMLVQCAFDLLVLRLLGFYALGYLAFGTLFGLGAHPMTGHFISEHYLFADQQATHSYYGPWNPLIYNLGYHVEHHDFPYIAFTRLPKLHEIAPEYYAPLPYHASLCKVIWDFLFYPENGPQAHCVNSEDKSRPELYENAPKGLILDYYKNK
ncbi:Peptidase M neutral zinc metallopeptidases zinc binding site [Paragonimus heterotremus]|uniref:Peptidase M neutral zinc metallopeptidases zinc binding site n=1 Tax=Paragonimus heterotremus TaxID=100268 RepID=A0A8J4WHM2_9TREM|nr:Peptidase M neutral zinc metallopeptidases zinc binding site [Paragonimus heterotremus]